MVHSGKSIMSTGTITPVPSARPLSEALRDLRGFVPLDQEIRTHVSTKVMCFHLDRKEQTARGWACNEDGPLRPIRVNGRLAWPVDDIRRILGVTPKVGG